MFFGVKLLLQQVQLVDKSSCSCATLQVLAEQVTARLSHDRLLQQNSIYLHPRVRIWIIVTRNESHVLPWERRDICGELLLRLPLRAVRGGEPEWGAGIWHQSPDLFPPDPLFPKTGFYFSVSKWHFWMNCCIFGIKTNKISLSGWICGGDEAQTVKIKPNSGHKSVPMFQFCCL